MNKIIQSRLLFIAGIFLLLQTIIITLAPAVRARSWDVAAEKFKALVLRDSDGPAYYYLQLCSEYQKSPPESWDGIVPLSEK